MPSAPPPSQQQADEAQRARHAAEVAVLALFVGAGLGSGGDEDEQMSSVHAVRMTEIISRLSTAIVSASFRDPRDRNRKLLETSPDNDKIGDEVLPEAQAVFQNLLSSELDDEQRAIIWATWVYSQTADAVAEAVTGNKEGEFAGKKLRKVWISRSDGRVRELHRKLHGKTVGSSGDFWRWPATGQRLRWPGDPQAPLDATVGCRCVCLLTWADPKDVSTTIRKIVVETDPN